jgi:serpin B
MKEKIMNKKSIKWFVACAGVLFVYVLVLTSCNQLRGSSKMSEVVAGARVINDNNRFAFRVYNEIAKEFGSKNIVLSPYSMSEAMGMVYAGAAGDTAREIARAMRFSPRLDTHIELDNLRRIISVDSDEYIVKSANKLWGAEDIQFTDDFKMLTESYYDALATTTDLTSFEGIAKIDKWIKERTRNLITKSGIQPHPSMKLVLVNSAFFKAPWSPGIIFVEDDTLNTFNGVRDRDIKFMQASANFRYVKKSTYQAVGIDYKSYEGDESKDTYFVIFLPNRGRNLASISSRVARDFPEIAEQFKREESSKSLRLSMPKFDFDFSTELQKTLQSLGIRKAFDNTADFSNMNGKNDLYLGQAVHKARISVDEKGTVAAAMTAVGMMTKGMIEYTDLIVDRPFMFAIVHKATGTILFMGSVVRPW